MPGVIQSTSAASNSLPPHITLDLLERLEKEPTFLGDDYFTDVLGRLWLEGSLKIREAWPFRNIHIFHLFFRALLPGLDRSEISREFSRPNSKSISNSM